MPASAFSSPELDALCAADGSSSEDTSDEAYVRRHQPLQEEERSRYDGAPGALPALLAYSCLQKFSLLFHEIAIR